MRPKAGELALGLKGAELLSVSRSGELAVLLPRFETGNAYTQSGTLAVVSASGGTPRKLADGVIGADWAPDGQSLAVLRVAEGQRRLEYPLGTLLYASPNEVYCIRVSPKGDEVAFFEYDDQGKIAVAVVDRSGGRKVWSGGWPNWWNLAWSPGGDEIWFGAAAGGNASTLSAVDRRGKLRTLLAAPGALELHDVARHGGILAAQVQATSQVFGGRVGGASERNLSWLEDSRVADLSSDGTLALLSVLSEREAGGLFGVYLRSMDGSPPVRLGSGKAKELSRDGKWALAIRGDALVALPTAEGEERVLATGFSSLIEARWLPDGLHVLVAGTDPDGSTRAKLVGFERRPRANGRGAARASRGGRGQHPAALLRFARRPLRGRRDGERGDPDPVARRGRDASPARERAQRPPGSLVGGRPPPLRARSERASGQGVHGRGAERPPRALARARARRQGGRRRCRDDRAHARRDGVQLLLSAVPFGSVPGEGPAMRPRCAYSSGAC